MKEEIFNNVELRQEIFSDRKDYFAEEQLLYSIAIQAKFGNIKKMQLNEEEGVIKLKVDYDGDEKPYLETFIFRNKELFF